MPRGDDAHSLRGVVVTSRWRMWWLTLARGYAVRMVKRRPRASVFGRIRYTVEWVLRKREGAAAPAKKVRLEVKRHTPGGM